MSIAAPFNSAAIEFPSIDEMASRLVELGALAEGDWDEFKRLELFAMRSARKEDALGLYSRLPDSDPAKMAMDAGLEDLRSWSSGRVAEAPEALGAPRLWLVSGAPGSGKSARIAQLAKGCPEALIASADDFKTRFKEKQSGSVGALDEPARSDLMRSVYIHRLTALPSWEMVDLALDAKKNLIVELLGLGVGEDERTARRALAKGYKVKIEHVGCSVEQSLARATKRHFEQKALGGEGRWIGMAAAVAKQQAILGAFAQLCALLAGSGAAMELFDNSSMGMQSIWSSESGGAPPTGMFANWLPKPGLWRPGANPVADLCALRRESGVWQIALVERGCEPCKGSWALPGGFIKSAGSRSSPFLWGAESPEEAALRRFAEKTLCPSRPNSMELIGKSDELARDPRNNSESWVQAWTFAAVFDSPQELFSGDGARGVRWASLSELRELERLGAVAFDHASLAKKAFSWAASRLH